MAGCGGEGENRALLRDGQSRDAVPAGPTVRRLGGNAGALVDHLDGCGGFEGRLQVVAELLRRQLDALDLASLQAGAKIDGYSSIDTNTSLNDEISNATRTT